LALGAQRERRRLAAARERLLACVGPALQAPLDARALDELPGPVRRYLQRAVAGVRMPVRVVCFAQQGVLRTDTATQRWLPFRADQLVVPGRSASPGTRASSWHSRCICCPGWRRTCACAMR
jgi:hypothetical protein